MEVIIDGKKFELVRDYKNAFDATDLEGKITDYYDVYDYILGDYAYGKVRLKGFTEKENKNHKPINDFSKIDEYINNYCAYECKYFILKKVIEKG